MDSFVEEHGQADPRKSWRWQSALCALSGGVDSSVAAGLLSKAIGKQLTCVFVDHGLLRKNEGDEVEAGIWTGRRLSILTLSVSMHRIVTIANWQGLPSRKHKRKIIGEEFIRVFEEEAKKIGAVDFLGTGNHLSGRCRIRSWR